MNTQSIAFKVPLICVVLAAIHASNIVSASPTRQHAIIANGTGDKFDKWFYSNWTGDDDPYAEIRAKIDGQIRQGTPTYTVLQNIRAAYPASQSPASVFARGYAAFCADGGKDFGTAHYDDALAEQNQEAGALLYGPNQYPHTYNFIRLAYLLLGNVYYKNIGTKLLKADPTDQTIEDKLTSDLAQSDKRSDLDLAYNMARKRLALHPNDDLSFDLLAQVHAGEYNLTKDPKYGELAISYYGEALKIDQSLPALRTYYTTRISTMQKLMAIDQSKATPPVLPEGSIINNPPSPPASGSP